MAELSNNLAGQRFGRWTVIKRKGSKTYIGSDGKSTTFPLYLCRCDCGAECIVIAQNLKSGRSKSCGCLRDELVQERLKRKREGKNHAAVL